MPIEAVIDLHAGLLGEHGGAPGLRDRGALESALARPQQMHAYGSEADLSVLAAAYVQGITQNHPFVDGNKRVAFVTLGVFLLLNDIYLDATEKESEQVIVNLSAGQLTEPQLVVWLRRNCVPLTP
ncbi:MAG: type II toxin-antitoxin system death-on-curing family toxin [Geminicoccaceae bacterium]